MELKPKTLKSNLNVEKHKKRQQKARKIVNERRLMEEQKLIDEGKIVYMPYTLDDTPQTMVTPESTKIEVVKEVKPVKKPKKRNL